MYTGQHSSGIKLRCVFGSKIPTYPDNKSPLGLDFAIAESSFKAIDGTPPVVTKAP